MMQEINAILEERSTNFETQLIKSEDFEENL